ncbi:hypothetical protein UCREL1_3934 [Eutypa lata UCREL1]|uniref:Uncharacterized protein n=1 Tax=Eutypa lata (strain UCR-EL1) TaxID=1287681 RepID=M7SRF2_EUTLA|nr:hypothetical protein UCREL1_3934 [Eutypa lata UCREL1]
MNIVIVHLLLLTIGVKTTKFFDEVAVFIDKIGSIHFIRLTVWNEQRQLPSIEMLSTPAADEHGLTAIRKAIGHVYVNIVVSLFNP